MPSVLNTDYIKEQIKFLSEILKIIFALFLATITGTIALIIKKPDTLTRPKELFFIAIGMVLTIVSGGGLLFLYRAIVGYIRFLNR
ncbi:hypothetical protein [Spirosoma areae]